MRFSHAVTWLAVLYFWVNTVAAQTMAITGAGASFPAPLYQRWAQDAQRDTQIQLNYQSIGSGGGINQIMARTVDFGATDAPLSEERLAQNNLIQVPITMGAVVLAYNLPGVQPGALRLTPDVLADIYLGRITRWTDARIVSINSHIRIPNLPLGVVYRGDGSGTTWIFTNYLSRVSDTWKAQTGSGTNVSWPAGQGARGNEGVSNMVQRTPGLIGYMELSFAQVNRLSMAQLQNAHGAFVQSTTETNLATAQNANWGSTLVPDLINQPGQLTWPIMGATYILIPTNPPQAMRSRAVTDWITWALTNGDGAAERLFYVPLPATIKQQVQQQMRERIQLP